MDCKGFVDVKRWRQYSIKERRER